MMISTPVGVVEVDLYASLLRWSLDKKAFKVAPVEHMDVRLGGKH